MINKNQSTFSGLVNNAGCITQSALFNSYKYLRYPSIFIQFKHEIQANFITNCYNPGINGIVFARLDNGNKVVFDQAFERKETREICKLAIVAKLEAKSTFLLFSTLWI